MRRREIPPYRPGQNVVAKIVKCVPGGYFVFILKDHLPGYLPSDAQHYIGDDVLATFLGVDNNRFMLSERFTQGNDDAFDSSQVPQRPPPDSWSG